MKYRTFKIFSVFMFLLCAAWSWTSVKAAQGTNGVSLRVDVERRADNTMVVTTHATNFSLSRRDVFVHPKETCSYKEVADLVLLPLTVGTVTRTIFWDSKEYKNGLVKFVINVNGDEDHGHYQFDLRK